MNSVAHVPAPVRTRPRSVTPLRFEPLESPARRPRLRGQARFHRPRADAQACATLSGGARIDQSLDGVALVEESLRVPGRPLDTSTRSLMERKFAYDFSRVRVHTDVDGGESARTLRVRAYTVGSDIVFGTSQYAPGTSHGFRLLAHELTHVLQQSNLAAPHFSSESYLGAEREAEHAADLTWEPDARTLRPHVVMGYQTLQAETETEQPWHEWALSAIGGEFIDEPTFGQIGVDFVLSVIPIVDQVADARDLVAHVYRLGIRGEHDRWERWVALVFTLIGLVPEVGSVIKSLSKLALRGLSQLMEHIGDLLRIARDVVRIDIPDLERLRRYLLSNWTRFVNIGVEAWTTLLTRGRELVARVPRLLREVRAGLLGAIENLRRISPGWLSRAFEHVRSAIDDILTQARERLGRRAEVSAEVPPPSAAVTRTRRPGRRRERIRPRLTRRRIEVLPEAIPTKRFAPFREPFRDAALRAEQDKILRLPDRFQAGREYQRLVARDLGATGLGPFSREGRIMDIGTHHEVTIEGMTGRFSSGKFDQLWIDLEDLGQIQLTVPRLSEEARSQLLRLGRQFELESGSEVLIIVRETLP